MIKQLVISDTIKQPPEVLKHPKIVVRSVADLLAQAIWCIHTGASISALIEKAVRGMRRRRGSVANLNAWLAFYTGPAIIVLVALVLVLIGSWLYGRRSACANWSGIMRH